MQERTSRIVGNALLVAGLLCFLGGAGVLVSGTSVDTTIYALGALGLVFVGAGASIRNRA